MLPPLRYHCAVAQVAQATAPPAKRKQAFFPPGKTHADIEQGVRFTRFRAPSCPLTPLPVRHPAVPHDALDGRGPAHEDPARVSLSLADALCAMLMQSRSQVQDIPFGRKKKREL